MVVLLDGDVVLDDGVLVLGVGVLVGVGVSLTVGKLSNVRISFSQLKNTDCTFSNTNS